MNLKDIRRLELLEKQKDIMFFLNFDFFLKILTLISEKSEEKKNPRQNSEIKEEKNLFSQNSGRKKLSEFLCVSLL